MNYKVKIFENETPYSLQDVMKSWFENHPGIIVHKMTQSAVIVDDTHYTTIVILYTTVH